MIFEHYFSLIRVYRWPIIGIILGTPLIAFLLSSLWLLAMPFYSAQTTVNLIPTDSELMFAQGASGRGGDPTKKLVQTHIEYLLSRPVAEMTLDKLLKNKSYLEPPPVSGFDAFVQEYIVPVIKSAVKTYRTIDSGYYVKPTEKEQLLNELMDGISVEPVEGSFVLRIEVTTKKRRGAAALICNTLAEVYLERIRTQVRDAATAAISELNIDLSARQDALEKLAQRRVELRQEFKIMNPITEVENLLETREDERQKLQDDTAALAELEARLAAFRDELSILRSKGLAAEVEQELALSGPKRAALTRRIAQRKRSIDQVDTTIGKLAAKEKLLQAIDREQNMINEEISALLDAVISAKKSRDTALSEARIISPAMIPTYPEAPRVLVYTIVAGFAGIFGAAFFVLLLDTISGTLKTNTDLVRVASERSLGIANRRLIKSVREELSSRQPEEADTPFGQESLLRIVDKVRLKKGDKDRLNSAAKWTQDVVVTLGTHGNSAVPVFVTGYGSTALITEAAVAIAAIFSAQGRETKLLFSHDNYGEGDDCTTIINGGSFGIDIDWRLIEQLKPNFIVVGRVGETRARDLVDLKSTLVARRYSAPFVLLLPS